MESWPPENRTRAEDAVTRVCNHTGASHANCFNLGGGGSFKTQAPEAPRPDPPAGSGDGGALAHPALDRQIAAMQQSTPWRAKVPGRRLPAIRRPPRRQPDRAGRRGKFERIGEQIARRNSSRRRGRQQGYGTQVSRTLLPPVIAAIPKFGVDLKRRSPRRRNGAAALEIFR